MLHYAEVIWIPSGPVQTRSMAPSATSPLAGIRVLEFSHTIMGPCAGLLLADLGADVIKIEPAPGGDKTRGLHGFAAGFFATFNRNKRSVAINLKTPAGQEIVKRLVQDVDVVLDNYGPGTMEKLGCGCDELRRLNPALVYLSLKGYLNGPWAERPALDEVVQFQSGLAYMTGPPGQPLRAGASIIDILGAVFGVTGVLSALRERDKTGEGQRVGSSLFESAAFLMASHMIGGVTTGQSVPPMTARKGAWGIYDVFATADKQQIFIGVTSDAQWERFCEVFNLPDLLADARLTTNPQRTMHREWLIPQLNDVVCELPSDVVIKQCQDAAVSWSPVGRPEDLLLNEQLLSNGGLVATALSTVENAADQSVALGETLLPGLPLEFGDDRHRPVLYRQPPAMGEHTGEVLLQAGLPASELSELARQNVICGSIDT